MRRSVPASIVSGSSNRSTGAARSVSPLMIELRRNDDAIQQRLDAIDADFIQIQEMLTSKSNAMQKQRVEPQAQRRTQPLNLNFNSNSVKMQSPPVIESPPLSVSALQASPAKQLDQSTRPSFSSTAVQPPTEPSSQIQSIQHSRHASNQVTQPANDDNDPATARTSSTEANAGGSRVVLRIPSRRHSRVHSVQLQAHARRQSIDSEPMESIMVQNDTSNQIELDKHEERSNVESSKPYMSHMHTFNASNVPPRPLHSTNDLAQQLQPQPFQQWSHAPAMNAQFNQYSSYASSPESYAAQAHNDSQRSVKFGLSEARALRQSPLHQSTHQPNQSAMSINSPFRSRFMQSMMHPHTASPYAQSNEFHHRNQSPLSPPIHSLHSDAFHVSSSQSQINPKTAEAMRESHRTQQMHRVAVVRQDLARIEREAIDDLARALAAAGERELVEIHAQAESKRARACQDLRLAATMDLQARVKAESVKLEQQLNDELNQLQQQLSSVATTALSIARNEFDSHRQSQLNEMRHRMEIVCQDAFSRQSSPIKQHPEAIFMRPETQRHVSSPDMKDQSIRLQELEALKRSTTERFDAQLIQIRLDLSQQRQERAYALQTQLQDSFNQSAQLLKQQHEQHLRQDEADIRRHSQRQMQEQQQQPPQQHFKSP